MSNTIFIFHVALLTLHVSLSRCDLLSPDDDDKSRNITGFTVDLIHIDSPQSPFYDPSLSPTQRLDNEIRRSLHRLRARRLNLTRLAQSPEVDITLSKGDYIMKYTIGTPPVPSVGFVDTGSDLIWTQCTPCSQCFKQTPPLFKPESSSTYRKIPCNTADCERSDPVTFCSANKEDCLFSVVYADKTASSGVLSIDTFSFASTGGSRTMIPNIVFGCGTRNDGEFTTEETGIVGLGGGAHSLINQLGPLAKGRFSYCLTSRLDRATNSKMHFGDNAVVAGRGVVSIPLMRKDPKTFYHVTLLDITVGYRRLGLYNRSSSTSKFVEEGNMIVDSGATLVRLPKDSYAKLRNAVQSQVKLRQVKDPKKALDLCFEAGRSEVPFPAVTFHFRGGDVILENENIFVGSGKYYICLAALPIPKKGETGVFGYFAQANFLVGFDLEKWLVYFKRTDCSKL